MGETKEAGGQKDAHAQEDARILAEVGGRKYLLCVFFLGGGKGGVKRVERYLYWLGCGRHPALIWLTVYYTFRMSVLR